MVSTEMISIKNCTVFEMGNSIRSIFRLERYNQTVVNLFRHIFIQPVMIAIVIVILIAIMLKLHQVWPQIVCDWRQ